jgi:hypothetical protein
VRAKSVPITAFRAPSALARVRDGLAGCLFCTLIETCAGPLNAFQGILEGIWGFALSEIRVSCWSYTARIGYTTILVGALANYVHNDPSSLIATAWE